MRKFASKGRLITAAVQTKGQQIIQLKVESNKAGSKERENFTVNLE